MAFVGCGGAGYECKRAAFAEPLCPCLPLVDASLQYPTAVATQLYRLIQREGVSKISYSLVSSECGVGFEGG